MNKFIRIGLLILTLVAAVWWYIVAVANPESARRDARDHAHIEIESLKAVHCTPDDAKEFDEVNTARFEHELANSPLETDEKQNLLAAWNNNMELAGCGFGARNQPAPTKRHKK